MIKLIGEKLRQYDLNRSVELIPKRGHEVEEVLFQKNSPEALSVAIREEDSKIVASIPNVLLKSFGTLAIECHYVNEHGDRISERMNFYVSKRAMPAGYVYEETPVLSLGSGGELPWGETTTVKEVLAECQPNVDCNTGQILIKEDFLVEVGQKYILTLNGVDHIATAFDTAGLEGFEGADVLLSNGESLEDANATFFVIHVRDGEMYHGTMVVPEGFTVKSISIRQEVTEVKKISGKYVEGMGYVEKLVVLPNHTLVNGVDNGRDGVDFELPGFELKKDEDYILCLNGTDYLVTAKYEGQGMNAISLKIDGEKVINISAWGGGATCRVYYGSNVSTISICEAAEIIHPIDQKFLPSGGGGGGEEITINVDMMTGAATCALTSAEIISKINSGNRNVTMDYAGGDVGIKSRMASFNQIDSETCVLGFVLAAGNVDSGSGAIQSFTFMVLCVLCGADGFQIGLASPAT